MKYEGYVKPQDGELTFPSTVEEDQYHQLLERFNNENLWLEIQSKEPTRSQRQHRFYWVYIEEIARQTGYSKNEIHQECKWRFLKWTANAGMGSKSYIEAPTTKNLTKQEFNEYIREIESWTGIPAPSKSRYKLT